MKFILASKSQRRSDILKDMGLRFEVIPSNAEEVEDGIYPPQIPIVNAVAKASDIATQYPDALVLGADTVIEIDGTVIGKPTDLNEAGNILRRLAGRTHYVISGVCLLSRSDNMQCIFADTTAVTFRNLSESDIVKYLDKVYVLDKAGAYAIQEDGDMLIERISGSLNNVIGLPSERLQEFLECSSYLKNIC